MDTRIPTYIDGVAQSLNERPEIYSAKMANDHLEPTRPEFYRIELCIRGWLRIRYGNETFILTRGSLHVNYPGQLYSILERSEDMGSFVMIFARNLINQVISEKKIPCLYPFLDYGGSPFLQLSEEEINRTAQFFLDIDWEIKNAQSDKLEAIKLLISLLLLNTQRIYRENGFHKRAYHPDWPANKSDMEKMYQIRDTLLADLSLPLTLHNLAKSVCMSESKTKQLFRKTFGKSVYNYYQAARMDHAANLLKDFSVTETGYKLGFTNMSHFSRLFEKHHKIKPKKFKCLLTTN